MIFMINNKYFTFDILFDFSDFKNLDKKINEKIVKYLNNKQDLFINDLIMKIFIFQDFHNKIIDILINLS